MTFGYCGDYFGITSPESLEDVGVYAVTKDLSAQYGFPEHLLVMYHDYDLKECDCIDLSQRLPGNECPMANVEYRGSEGCQIFSNPETFFEYLENDLDVKITAQREDVSDW